MLTKTQIASLNRARATLEVLQHKLSDEESFVHGRLAEACERADEALFNILNIAKVYGISEISEADLVPERSDP